jgi:hypothetical protein
MHWGRIDHKSKLSGGPEVFGYPDPSYFSRARAQLAKFGVN